MDFLNKNKDFIGIFATVIVISLIVWGYYDGSKPKVDKPKANSKIAKLLKKIKKEGFIKGDKKARYTVLEYTELLCPFCKRHSGDKTLDELIENNKGDVNTISRVFKVHEQAQKLEEGLLCAQEDKDSQKYYSFLANLFSQDGLDQAKMLEVAANSKYDKAKLEACIKSGKYAKKVDQQTAEGRDNFGINGTPGNVIIDSKTGAFVIVEGAYPLEEFEAKLKTLK